MQSLGQPRVVAEQLEQLVDALVRVDVADDEHPQAPVRARLDGKLGVARARGQHVGVTREVQVSQRPSQPAAISAACRAEWLITPSAPMIASS